MSAHRDAAAVQVPIIFLHSRITFHYSPDRTGRQADNILLYIRLHPSDHFTLTPEVALVDLDFQKDEIT